MKKSKFAVFATAVLAATLFAAPAYADGVVIQSADPIQDSYIVLLKSGNKPDTVAPKTKIKRSFKSLNGFTLRASASEAKKIASDSRVDAVYEDGKVRISDTQTIPKPPNTYWGLNRIDQRSKPSSSVSGTYNYGYTGKGVHVYVIDTGILTTHSEFGGRATFDYTTSEWADLQPDLDCHGHGTHVAGTIGGKTFGVAKQVSLHAVKVLDCYGTGSYSGIIEGVDWVTRNAKRPAVVNMSLGGLKFAPLNSAVQKSINSGISYILAAGNASDNACDYSPGSTTSAITVAASGDYDSPYSPISDIRSWYSNYGNCVDLFAPGSYIKSAWADSDDSTEVISGTSMASPHVAGVAALALQKSPGMSPSTVTNTILNLSTKGKVTDRVGSPNRLLFAGGIPVLTVNAKPEPVKCGGVTTVTGTMAVGGAGISGRTVEIWFDPTGSKPPALRGTAVTSSSGSFSKGFYQTADGVWFVKYTGGVLIYQSKSSGDFADCN
jgi:subtilisin family serine protease